MTIQVGLVGSEGVVLASDRLVNVVEDGTSSHTLSSKFIFSDRIICCYSGDRVAHSVAQRIRDGGASAAAKDRSDTLRACTIDAWNTNFGNSGHVPLSAQRISRKVLVSFTDDSSLWVVEVSQDPLVAPVLDRVVAGGSRSSARYLTQNHFLKEQPIERLIILAAHTVLMGGRECPSDIGGLEVAIIRRGKPVQLIRPEQEQELTRMSEEIHSNLGNKLFEPFTL